MYAICRPVVNVECNSIRKWPEVRGEGAANPHALNRAKKWKETGYSALQLFRQMKDYCVHVVQCQCTSTAEKKLQ